MRICQETSARGRTPDPRFTKRGNGRDLHLPQITEIMWNVALLYFAWPPFAQGLNPNIQTALPSGRPAGCGVLPAVVHIIRLGSKVPFSPWANDESVEKRGIMERDSIFQGGASSGRRV